jgi:hypothetical protein
MEMNKRKMTAKIRFLAIISLCIFVIISLPFIYMCVNLTKDVYKSSIVSIPALKLFRMVFTDHGEIIIRSWIYIETTSSYEQVTAWYSQRGWTCDGACEGEYRSINIGPLYLGNDWSLMRPHDFQAHPIQIELYEEYFMGIH